MSQTLADIAPVIRSKNAGPTLLTIDVMFKDTAAYRRGLAAVTGDLVAKLYGLDPGAVKLAPYPPALALKITIPRLVSAGSPGDRDVYGAQQHTPLLTVPA